MAEDNWSAGSIESTVKTVGLTAGADSNLPDDARFVRRIREIVKRTYDSPAEVADRSTVFLLCPEPPDHVMADATYYPRAHTLGDGVPGKIWLMGTAARQGYAVDHESDDIRDVFTLVCESLQLGDAPAVLLEPGTGLLAWYPGGLCEPDVVLEGPLLGVEAPTMDDLLDVVSRVHALRLRTSHNQTVDTSLWEDPPKHWTHERAEKRVQDALMTGLGSVFGSPFFVDQEHSGDTGRYDIGFKERVEAGTTKLHAILELKVARSRGHTGISKSRSANIADIVSGIEQAHSYAVEHGADGAACLLFDLRLAIEQNQLGVAVQRAKDLNVLLRSWLCFPTAAAYRASVVAQSSVGD